MKILHLLSDWKWTGPSEPIVNLCKELGKRGHEVVFAYRKPPFPFEDGIEKRILGENLSTIDRFHLNRPIKFYSLSSIKDNISDILDLASYLQKEKIDILNVHQSHDHILGGISARRSGYLPVVIRTDHNRDPLRATFGNRLLISKLTDGLITFSQRAKAENVINFGLPPERIVRISPALDLARYNRVKGFRDMRSFFGIREDTIVIGMVARFQKYRKTDLFLRALKIIVKEFPNIKLLLIGRSSQMNESVIKPIKMLKIEPWVILGGYRREDYIDTLACMDIFVFLMAGSDGTARALREAMALGKPSIVADRGMLPELVEDGISGLVVRDSPEELAQATLKLLRNLGLRRDMGRAAYEKAHREFRLEHQAEEVEKFYQKIINLGRWKR